MTRVGFLLGLLCVATRAVAGGAVTPTAFSFGPDTTCAATFRVMGPQTLQIDGTGAFTVEVPHWAVALPARGDAPATVTLYAYPSLLPPNQVTAGSGRVLRDGEATMLILYGQCTRETSCTAAPFMPPP